MRTSAAPVAVNFFVGSALIVALVVVPVYANVVLHDDTAHGALTLLKLTAPIPVGAVVGALVPRLAPAGLCSRPAVSLWLGRATACRRPRSCSPGSGSASSSLPSPSRRSSGRAAGGGRGGRADGGADGRDDGRPRGADDVGARASSTAAPAATRSRRRRPERTSYERHLTDAALYVFGRVYLVAAVLCLAGAACAWASGRAGFVRRNSRRSVLPGMPR